MNYEKRKKKYWISSKFKAIDLQKAILRKSKNKPNSRRNYLQGICSTKDLYVECITKYSSSRIRRQTNILNGQKT